VYVRTKSTSHERRKVQIERVEQSDWLSNAYLIADEPGGKGVLIDGNGVIEPLLERADRDGTEITHILLTHGHWDHVVGIGELASERGVPVLAHEAVASEVPFTVDRTLADGDTVETGGLTIEALETPGHAPGHLAFLVNGTDLVTGDLIFKGTIAGTVAPGAAGFDALRGSIMDRVMTLPPDTRLHPGHCGPSTVGEEMEQNPFVRVWRGLDPEGTGECEVNGRGRATLVVWGPDYDGTNKAWVRFPDGSEAVTGGSQVTR
jgi:hydroxyacylglutathione hydrolase